jgi:predicted phage terminase large subunit-like protein
MLSELWEKLRIPTRSPETLAEYLAMKKARQDDLKDIGGYVCGALSGPRRKASGVIGRDVITLDLDSIPAGGAEDVLRRAEGLGAGYCVYSTRKHHPAEPRLRVLIPLDRTVSADEYEPAARKIAEYLGLEMADPTTFEAARLMYWPSCCSDSQYIYRYADKPFVSADGLLAQYTNWRDVSLWPSLPGVQTFTKLAVKQGDPENKTGVVGAFCRVYDVHRAIDELIPGQYEPVDTACGRYTYQGGSTTGGAVVYDGGKFLYSHHATDPCSGKLVNAFDLVRLHRFAELDDEAQPNTFAHQLPSYKAMLELAAAIPDVLTLVYRERSAETAKDFEGIAADDGWKRLLEINSQTAYPKATIDNVRIILEYDPNLKGKFALNLFAGRGEVLGALPWESGAKRRLWGDNDNNGLYWYMEKEYRITGNAKIDAALSLHSNKFAFNEVQDYLQGCVWDGTQRLDTLYIDYLGAADTPYNRIAARKSAAAAVARAGAKHLNLLCQKLEGIERGELEHLIITMPPRHGKSMTVTETFPSWFIGRNPERRVIEVSYGNSFARKFGRANRRKVEEFGKDLFRIEVSRENRSATNWGIAGMPGGMVSSGYGGHITGEGADLLLIDDPVRNRKDAESQTCRETVWAEWQNTLQTRLHPRGAILIIMTRWHKDDLAGRILAGDAGKNWAVVNLPAIAEQNDSLGRSPGEPLWPEHGFDEKWAEQKKRDVGTRAWDALYQGRPSIAEGNLFKRRFFRSFRERVNGTERTYELLMPEGSKFWPAQNCRVFQTCDAAASTKTSADFFVLGTFAVTPESELLVLDILRTRVEGPDQPDLIRRHYERYKPALIGVESKNMGITLFQSLVRMGLPVAELKPETDKFTRAVPAAARCAVGSVYHPIAAQWLDDYESELCAFPNAAHDDQADVLAYAVLMVLWGYFNIEAQETSRVTILG